MDFKEPSVYKQILNWWLIGSRML